MAPAHADPVPATLAFARSADSVEPGSVLVPNALSVRNNSSDLTLCVIGLDVPASDFEHRGFPGPQEVGPNEDLPLGTVTGRARQDVGVIATLSYAFADARTGCSGEADQSASATWSIQIVEPEPSPTPTEEPPEEPTEEPSEEPTEEPTREPSPSPTGNPTRTPAPTVPPAPTETDSSSPSE
ncbi:MAG: hypothetical protein JK586_05680, partial [Nocardiopsis sp. BM-2018]